MVDIEVRASPPNGTGGKHTEWITKIHLALWKKTHVTCFGWLNMFKQSHRTILDNITFLYFSILILQRVISSVVHLQTSVRHRNFLDIFFTCRTVFLSPQIQIILHIHRERSNRILEKINIFNICKGWFLRSTFCKCMYDSKKIRIWSPHVVLSHDRLRSKMYYISVENEAIE